MQFLRPLLLAAMAFFATLPARAFETQATAAWVYDLTTQTVLMDKNGEVALPPASMSKLMTLNMLFEALADGRVTLDTTFAVSEKAWKMGGSKMFVKPDDRPSVQDLIHGIIINSGNDACVVVAEGLAGSEETFASLMNERAAALGMTNSNFANSSGWPDPGQRMSARDLGVLAVRLITEFPDLYQNFGLTTFNYKDRVPANSQNRNPLLRIKGGDWQADGLKTGHTQEAGFGLVGSAIDTGGRRIVFVIMGLPSESARAQEAEAVANWAFRQFVQKTVVKAGSRIAEADVWLGAADKVGLAPARDLVMLVPSLAQQSISAEVVYTGPVKAPIAKGQEIATLIVRVGNMPEQRVPLVAEADVAGGGFLKRLMTAGRQLAEDRLLGGGGAAGPAS